MKVCVTGGAGFIGSNLVDRLLTDGYEVVVIDNLSSGKMENLRTHPKLTFLKRNILENVENAIEGCSVVFHLAAIPQVQFSIKHPIETNRINVNGMLNILDTCLKKNVKRFVFSSSAAIYGDQDRMPVIETMKSNPMSPYALQKLVGETYCRLYQKLYGLETVCLRYFNVYGPKQNPNSEYSSLIPKFIRNAKSNKILTIFGDGNQTRDFVFVSDVVNANLFASTTQNKDAFDGVFNIGSGENHSVNQVVDVINKLSGGRVKISHVSPVIEPRNSLAGIDKSERILKWRPEISFENGLSQTYELFSL